MKWTDEELIKAALSEGEIDSSNLDEIDRFIFEHKIYATKQRVEASIIYFTYVNWKIENKEDNAIGIDVGIKTYLVDSNHGEIQNPRILLRNIVRLRKLSRAFSRKLKKHKKGTPLSKNAEKAKLKLQLLHERVANQRKDFPKLLIL